MNVCKEFTCVSSLLIVYIPGPQGPIDPRAPKASKTPKTPKVPKAPKAPKAPRWGPALTEECEMKNCAAGEYVAVTQARRSNL